MSHAEQRRVPYRERLRGFAALVLVGAGMTLVAGCGARSSSAATPAATVTSSQSSSSPTEAPTGSTAPGLPKVFFVVTVAAPVPTGGALGVNIQGTASGQKDFELCGPSQGVCEQGQTYRKGFGYPLGTHIVYKFERGGGTSWYYFNDGDLVVGGDATISATYTG